MNAKHPAEGRKHKVIVQGWNFFFFSLPSKTHWVISSFLYDRTSHWNPDVHKYLEKWLKLTSSVPEIRSEYIYILFYDKLGIQNDTIMSWQPVHGMIFIALLSRKMWQKNAVDVYSTRTEPLFWAVQHVHEVQWRLLVLIWAESAYYFSSTRRLLSFFRILAASTTLALLLLYCSTTRSLNMFFYTSDFWFSEFMTTTSSLKTEFQLGKSEGPQIRDPARQPPLKTVHYDVY